MSRTLSDAYAIGRGHGDCVAAKHSGKLRTAVTPPIGESVGRLTCEVLGGWDATLNEMVATWECAPTIIKHVGYVDGLDHRADGLDTHPRKPV